MRTANTDTDNDGKIVGCTDKQTILNDESPHNSDIKLKFYVQKFVRERERERERERRREGE